MIEAINVQQFRNIEHAEVELSPLVNLVTGGNRGGKSSFAAALEAWLTGRPGFVNDAGTGLEHLIRRGAKRATITVKAGHVEGTRSIPAKDGAALDSQLAGLFGSRALVQACVRSRHLLARPAEEQQALLHAALHVDLSDEAYVAACNKQSAGVGDFVRPHLAAARRAKGGPEAYAREQRKGATAAKKQTKADIDALERSMPAVAPVAATDLVAEQLRHVQESIATIQARGRVKDETFLQALAAWERSRQQMARAQADVTSAEREHASAQGNLSTSLAKWGDVTQEDVDAAAQAKISAVEAQNIARAEQARINREMVATTTSAVCPAWEHLRFNWGDFSEIERQGQDCPARGLLAKRVEDLGRRAQQAEAAVKAADAVVDAAEEARYQADYRHGMLKTYRTKIKFQSDNLFEARKRLFDLGDLPEKPVAPVEGPDTELASLQARKRALEAEQAAQEKVAQAAAAMKDRQRQVEGLKKRLVSQEQDAARWDLLVTLLASSGVQADLAVKPVAEFAAEVDAICRDWFSLAFRIVNDPEKGVWHFECWNLLDSDPPESGPWVPLGFGCGNEAVLACAVLQVELAARAGFPLVILDELGLDAEWRPQLIGYLLEQDVQSIVLQPANDRDDDGALVRPDIHVPGLAVFWAEGGKITCLADGRESGSEEPEQQAAA